MFTSLHELAKQATLMITIAAEGDGQLRVNVTPVPFDTKAKANLPQPLSLVASPAEFDADFTAALTTWHAPKRSLVEQAQAAAGGAPAAAPALPAPKASTKTDKTSKKSRGKGGTDDEAGAVLAAGEAAGEAGAGADQVMAGEGEPGASDEPPADSASAPAPSADASPAASVDAAPAPAAAAHEPTAADLTLDLF